MVKYVSTYMYTRVHLKKQRSVRDLSNDASVLFLCFFFSDFLYKSICCGYSFELRRQVNAIQIGTHNICLYKEVDKKYTGYNLKNCSTVGL